MRGDGVAGLSLSGISHAFDGHPVLNDVDVDVAPGELVCLLGPSGCGKTTLLRIAAGLEPLQIGRVTIEGTTIAEGGKTGHVPPERRGVGLMFQDYALFPHLTVRENIVFGLGRGGTGKNSQIDETLGSMGLVGYADAYPHTLSGGQQQRVALMRALAPAPRVLLLDEPFSGLDVTLRAHVRADTLQIVKQSGAATLMVTHDPEEAMFMADRILLMQGGRVVQDGSPTDLYFAPRNRFVAEFFGPVNRFPATVRDGQAETSVGIFPAPGMFEGETAEVLVRPEAFRPAEDGRDAAAVEVIAARPLGRSSFILGRLADGMVIEARVPGVFMPQPGETVRLTVNSDQAHVFGA